MHSVYLVRHGKSSMEGSEAERGLEPEGEVHAEAICSRLQSLNPAVKAIYASPYRRAQLTMAPLAEHLGLPITVIDDFREKDMSDQPVDDMKGARLKMWEDFDFRLPGGESIREAQARSGMQHVYIIESAQRDVAAPLRGPVEHLDARDGVIASLANVSYLLRTEIVFEDVIWPNRVPIDRLLNPLRPNLAQQP